MSKQGTGSNGGVEKPLTFCSSWNMAKARGLGWNPMLGNVNVCQPCLPQSSWRCQCYIQPLSQRRGTMGMLAPGHFPPVIGGAAWLVGPAAGLCVTTPAILHVAHRAGTVWLSWTLRSALGPTTPREAWSTISYWAQGSTGKSSFCGFSPH